MWDRASVAALLVVLVAAPSLAAAGGPVTAAAGTAAGVDAASAAGGSPGVDTTRVRKNVTDLGAGETAELRLSAAEEDAVGVRRVAVTADRAIGDTWVELAAVEGQTVVIPSGEPLRVVDLDAGDPDAISAIRLVVPIEQPGIGDASIDVYRLHDGAWTSVDYELAAVSASGDSVILEFSVAGPGYVAVTAPATTSTTVTPATTWPLTTTTASDEFVGDGARTVIGVVALLAAGLLALRGGR